MCSENKLKTAVSLVLFIIAGQSYGTQTNLEQRVIDLEIKSMMNKINLTGEFIAQGMYHKAEQTVYNINTEDKSFFGALEINATANATKNISVYTTLHGNYAYGENLVGRNVQYTSKTDKLTGDDLKITRAFIDWRLIDDRLLLSIGRLPTSYGPPQHIYNNTERQGTYPLLAYSLPFDGVALTYNITSPSNRNMSNKLRVAYSSQSNPSFDPLVGSDQGGRISKSSDLYTIIYEFSRKRFGKVYLPTLFITQFYGGKIANERAVEARGVLSEFGTDADTYSIYGDSDTMQNLKGFNAYLELNTPFNLPFDIYGSYTKHWFKRKGSLIAEVVEHNPATLTGKSYGDKVDLGGLLYNENEISGAKYLVGTRYRGDGWSLGVEYLNSGYGTIDSSTHTKRITSFYEAIGEGGHLYATKQIAPYAADVRVGFSRMLYDYEFKDFRFEKSNRRQDNAYMMLTVRF